MSMTNLPDEMDRDTWEATFGLTMNPHAGFDLFDDCHLAGIDPHRIWTLWEQEDDEMFIITPGQSSESCNGYLVTEVPWTEDQRDLVVVEPYDDELRDFMRGHGDIDDEE